MKKRPCSLLVLFLWMQLFAAAQTAGYRYKAPLDSISVSGFYNILLTPALNAHLKTDYSDLRIVNDSGKWVPHLLRYPNNEHSNLAITWDLKIIKKETTTTGDDLILKGTAKSISNILLTIKNTDAERYCTLTGSDDMLNWFIINDSILIKPEKNTATTDSYFDINFPPSTYIYFKIHINNKGKDPFNIISAGTRGSANDILPGSPAFVYHPPVENPSSTVLQKDSGKISYIRVVQSASYHFDKISFKISGVKYYYRNAELYIPTTAQHSFSNPGQLYKSFVVSNNSTLQFNLPTLKADTFYLLIHNEDNLPLKVEAVKTFAEFRVMTTWLEKGSQYKLLIDNETATSPNYDLPQLQINLHQAIPEVNIGTISAIPQSSITTATPSNQKWVLIISIIAAALVLGFFTFKQVQEMSTKKV